MARRNKSRARPTPTRSSQDSLSVEDVLAARRRRQRWSIPIGVVLLSVGLIYLATRESADSLYRKAKAVYATNPPASLALVEQSIARAAGNAPAAQVLRCRLYGRASQWDEALGYFDLIPHIEDAPADELTALGIEAMEAQQSYLARLALQRAGEITSPDQQTALERLAVLELSIGRTEAAWKVLERLKVLDAQNPTAAIIAGRILREERNPSGAEAQFQIAMENCQVPHACHLARRGRAAALLDLGDVALARRLWDQRDATQETPEDLLLLATLQRLEGAPGAALNTLSQLSPQDQNGEQAALLLGVCHLDLGDFQAAQKTLRGLIARNPYHKEAYHKLALSQQRLGLAEEARKNLLRSQELIGLADRILDLKSRLQTDSGDAALRTELADLYEKAGDFAVARRWRATLKR
jgi:tetratricopeptide (TPR) repeat protein